MRRLAAWATILAVSAVFGASLVWVGPDRTSAPRVSSTTSTTVDPVLVELRRLEGEIVRQAADQQDLRRTVTSLARASRSSHSARSRVITVAGSDVWARLRQCESGGNYAANTGNGYHGAYQADHGTWGGYGGYSEAHLAPPAVQDEWARALQARRGWQPWPACARKLGLR